jgi:hypothetical protein
VTYYLLVCRRCKVGGDATYGAVMPFGSAEARGKWAAAHTRGTGHDEWWVHDDVVRDRSRE